MAGPNPNFRTMSGEEFEQACLGGVEHETHQFAVASPAAIRIAYQEALTHCPVAADIIYRLVMDEVIRRWSAEAYDAQLARGGLKRGAVPIEKEERPSLLHRLGLWLLLRR